MHDGSDEQRFGEDLLEGFQHNPKRIPSKYFYDARGSALFERITTLPEYYLTRSEVGLLRAHCGTLARSIPRPSTLIEPGSGSSTKTLILLENIPAIDRYIAIDISPEPLFAATHALAALRPALTITPVVGDFTGTLRLPPLEQGRTGIVFFPGSTIGNFEPREATVLLRRLGALAGPSGWVLVGTDIPKSPERLEAAYDDAQGVTAQFNLNLIHRMRRELEVDLDPGDFEHRAVWQPEFSRVEMQLVARRTVTFALRSRRISIARGEAVVTEHCHKWSPDHFIALARSAGLQSVDVLVAPDEDVVLHVLRSRPADTSDP